jgi:hypothetical protein
MNDGEKEPVNRTCKTCGKKASLQTLSDDIHYCTVHAKKDNKFKAIDNKFKEFSILSSLQKIPIKRLQEFITHYNIHMTSKKPLKSELLATTVDYIKNNCFVKSGSGEKKKKANDYDLVKLGINLKLHFDKIFATKLLEYKIDHIVIENQIGPLAIRMKSLQAMVTQYFIMNGIETISYVSAINKLKMFEGTEFMYEDDTDEEGEKKIKITNEKTKYNKRKDKSVEIVSKLISAENWKKVFENHKKKDDLADSLLQGLWFSSSITK